MKKRDLGRFLILGIVALLGAFAKSAVRGDLLHDWHFDDPAGMELNHSRNEIEPLDFWSQPLGNSSTTGEGVFRIQRNGGGQNSRFDVGAFAENRPLFLAVDLAGWDLSNISGQTPQLRFSFMNGSAASTPGEITAEMRLRFIGTGQVTLEARADGVGGETSAAQVVFPAVQLEPVRLVLGYNPMVNRYQVRYRIGTGPWQLFFTGSTSSQRSGPSIRMYVLGEFNGGGENFLDIYRVLVATEADFGTGPDPIVINETRTESGTVWDLKGAPLFIGNTWGESGTVSVSDGGQFRSGFALVGQARGAEGRVEVVGENSSWSVVDGDLRVADEPGSLGAIEVGAGAEVRFGETGSRVVPNGPGRGFVGNRGNGSLRVTDRGQVSSKNANYGGYGQGGEGEMEVSGEESQVEIGSNLGVAANLLFGPSGGSGMVVVRDGAGLSVEGDAIVQADGSVAIASGATVKIGGDLFVKTGGSLDLSDGLLSVDGEIRIESGADFVWTGGTLEAGDLISGIEMIPAGLSLMLSSRDSFLRNADEEPILLGMNAGIEGQGTIFQGVVLGGGGSFLRGEAEGAIRLFGKVKGSGTIESARILGEVLPDSDGITLRDVSFAGEGAVRVEIGESAPVLRVDETVDFTDAELTVAFVDPPVSGRTFRLFAYADGESRLPPFRAISLPVGWELVGDTLHQTGAPAVETFAGWAEAHGLRGADAQAFADPDGDGLSNLGEFLLGGDPLDPRRNELAIASESDAHFLRWYERLAGDGVYEVECSDDLFSWWSKPLPSYSELAIANSDRAGYRQVEWELSRGGERGFFRVLADEAPERPVFPGKTWEKIADPEAVGFPAEALNEAEQMLEEMDSAGFMAVLGGRVLFEHGDLEIVSYSASVRKSILAMLYGRYVESGEIDLDATLGELGIDDKLGLLPVEKTATVHDLLRARSGIYHPRSNTRDNWTSAPRRGSQPPGSYYLYNNWDFNALGSIFVLSTGKTPYEALETDFARVLEMEDFSLKNQRWGGNMALSRHRAYYFYLSTRDMARIGLLMLRNGNWKGEQVIPEEWMEQMLFPWTPSHEMNPASRRSQGLGYSYLWWLREVDEESPYFGSYAGHGAGGQYILVVPKLDLVFAHKTLSSGTNFSVSRTQFYDLVDIFVRAMAR